MSSSEENEEAVLRRRHEAAVDAFRRRVFSLSSAGPEPHEGDLVFFDLAGPNRPWWTPLQRHPEHPELRFTVPVEQGHLAGSRDVLVPGEAGGAPFVIHCGTGVWIYEEDFFEGPCNGVRKGSLPPEDVTRAREMLEHIEGESLQPTDEQLRVDETVEYEEFRLGLVGASCELQDRLEGSLVVVRPEDFLPLSRCKTLPARRWDPSPVKERLLVAEDGEGSKLGKLLRLPPPSPPPDPDSVRVFTHSEMEPLFLHRAGPYIEISWAEGGRFESPPLATCRAGVAGDLQTHEWDQKGARWIAHVPHDENRSHWIRLGDPLDLRILLLARDKEEID